MREIKFRAWDYNNEKVIPWENIRIEKDENEVKLSVIVFDGSVGDHYDDFPIMQYTGVIDTNGTPIYEGDIVKCFYPKRNDITHTLLGNVTFIDGCWFITEPIRNYCSTLNSEFESLEVIGNIYENPELLEVETNA